MTNKVSITRGMANSFHGGRTKLVCQECGLHVPVYKGRYPQMCSACGGPLVPFQEKEEMENLIRRIARGENPESVVESALRQEDFWASYERWQQDALEEFNAKYAGTFGTKRLCEDGPDCVEFSEDGDAYLHFSRSPGIGGTNHIARAVTPWRQSPHYTESLRQEGFYVMTYGGGRYTSVAWFPTREEAQAEVDRIKMRGAWSGMPPKVEPDENSLGESLRHEQGEPPVDADRGGYLPSQTAVEDDRLGEAPDPEMLFQFRGFSIGDRVAVMADENEARGKIGAVERFNDDESITVKLDEGGNRKFQSYELSLVASDTGALSESKKHEQRPLDFYASVPRVLSSFGFSEARTFDPFIQKFLIQAGSLESRKHEFARMSFEDWMKAVDNAVWAKAGLSVYDLADAPFRDWYDSGVSPKSAASKAIRMGGGFESLKHEAFSFQDPAWVAQRILDSVSGDDLSEPEAEQLALLVSRGDRVGVRDFLWSLGLGADAVERITRIAWQFLPPDAFESQMKHEVVAGPLAVARDIVSKWRSIGATNVQIRQQIRKELSVMFPMTTPEQVEQILDTLSL